MSVDPEALVVQSLVSAGLNLVRGVNLFNGPFRRDDGTIKKDAVFVSSSSSPPPQRVMGESAEIRTEVINIHHRAARYSEGRTLMRAIKDYLTANTPPGCLDLYTLSSGPNHLGSDQQNNSIFSLNIAVVHEAFKNE